MRQETIYKYYVFGYNYALLHRQGLINHSRDTGVKQLKKFFDHLVELDLPVTKLVAADLKIALDKLEKSDADTVSKAVADSLVEAAKKLDATLDAEMKLRHAFIVTKKRYPIDSLMNSPQNLLGSGVWDELSTTAKKDFSLAAIQVALNQPTACAFHLMRAIEDHLKCLYWSFKKTKRLDKPMWGPMVSQLRSKKAPKPTPKLLDHLDGIRIHFRNPTQHPEAFYSIDECQDLLNQTITALNMISSEIKK